ncbi:MAG: hypothetical protein Q7S37_03270 [bacterium]|nr:hypothetical protein [bacterium]
MKDREIYIKKMRAKLERDAYDVEQLKGRVEKLGLAADQTWLSSLHTMREREDEIQFHLKYLHQKKNRKILSVAKQHIELLTKDLDKALRKLEKQYK